MCNITQTDATIQNRAKCDCGLSPLVGLVPRSSVSLLLGFSAMHRVSLVSRVTARSLHDNMLGCLLPSGVVYYARYTRIIHSIHAVTYSYLLENVTPHTHTASAVSASMRTSKRFHRIHGRTARRSMSRSTCFKQRWTLSVINLRPSN